VLAATAPETAALLGRTLRRVPGGSGFVIWIEPPVIATEARLPAAMAPGSTEVLGPRMLMRLVISTDWLRLMEVLAEVAEEPDASRNGVLSCFFLPLRMQQQIAITMSSSRPPPQIAASTMIELISVRLNNENPPVFTFDAGGAARDGEGRPTRAAPCVPICTAATASAKYTSSDAATARTAARVAASCKDHLSASLSRAMADCSAGTDTFQAPRLIM
jgi:hypothetical protein